MRRMVMLALSLLGLFDSLYLLWVYTSPSSPMVCVGGGCDAARASTYSHLGGLPLPIFGVVMYIFLALLIFMQPMISARMARIAQIAVAAISGVGFAFSLYLMGIEAFVVHAWCMWCVISAVVVTAIFALAILEARRGVRPLEAAQALDAVQKNFALVLFAAVIAVPSFVFLSHHGELPATPPPTKEAVEQHMVRPDTHFYGNPDAPVTVVEFGDFECPACGQAEKTAKEIRKNFGNRIRFAFRQFPLRSIHAQAEKAAEASECAAQQGKFWQAVDVFYGNQEDLSVPALSKYGLEIGLDSKKYVHCLQQGQMHGRVTQDIEDGAKLGVHATPTFFVDGRMIVGPIDYSHFSRLIEAELKLKNEEEANAASAPAAPEHSTVNLPAKSSRKPTAAPTPKSALKAAPKESSSDTMPVFGSTRNQLSGLSSATACSPEEAKQKQPALIRTDQAKTLFQDHSGAVFVDVRAHSAFESGHIPDALNLPIDDFQQRWNLLPRNRTIILYESGQSKGDICAASRAAGRILLAQGFGSKQVKVYQDGLAGWKRAGLPVRKQ